MFWLDDDKYAEIKIIRNIYGRGETTPVSNENKKRIEPFFKHFNIAKNTILILLTIPLCLMSPILYWVYTYHNDELQNFLNFLSISNPIIILSLFILLFFCEKFSTLLHKNIKGLRENTKEDNFIIKLLRLKNQDYVKLKLDKNYLGRKNFLDSKSDFSK